MAGQVALAGRSELAATVAPLTGPARDAVREATSRAEQRMVSLQLSAYRDRLPAREPSGRGRDRACDRASDRACDQRVTEGVPLIQSLIQSLLARGSVAEFLADDDLVAWLGVVLTHVRVRDEAWVRIDPDHPQPHIELWREVVRRVEEPYVAGPACLLAYAAFVGGDGGLANVALDRADQADPQYTMAGLLRDVMQAGLPPTAVRLRMTPEDLAEAWESGFHGEEEQEARQLEDRAG